MARIQESIEIAAPATTVFRHCHDLDRWPGWDERVVGAKLITPPPLRRGSLVRIDAARSGRYAYTWDAEYVDYQLPRGSTLKVIDAAPGSPFESGTESWELSQTGNGTRFTLTWVYQPRGLLARIADALGRRLMTRRTIRRSLQHLKATIEA
jgi:uncharacterized membrane protein